MATRRERVVLTLDDDFSGGMAKAAAVTALLNRELGRLSGQSVATSRSSQTFVRDVQRMSNEARGADRSINQLTGRLRLFADAAAIFGPAAVPTGGVLAAGVAGFASQLGFAAVAGGVLVGSMQGLGDTLKALNDAHLEPTAENLAKAEDAMRRLSPAAADFAAQAYGMLPALRAIRDMGSEGLFPGLTESLDDLERLAPVVGNIFSQVGTALGEIASDGAASLASDRWMPFFDFIATEAPTALSDMASALGSVTHGLAEMWMAFAPLNESFSGWLMDAATGFDEWASGLSQTQGFQDFVDYIRENGPRVAEAMGAIGNALVQIVEAAAPLGGVSLQIIKSLADVLATIADSDMGTALLGVAAGMAALSRATSLFQKVSATNMGGFVVGTAKASTGVRTLRADLAAMSTQYANVSRTQSLMLAGLSQTTGAAQRAKASVGGLVKSGAGLAGLGIIATGAADGIGLTNTASLGLIGTLGGPPGVAIGLAAGALLDLKNAGEGATASIDGLNAALASGDMSAITAQIEAAKAELEDINNLDFNAGDIFDRIGFQVADTFGGTSADEAAKKIRATEQAARDLAAAQSEAAHNDAFTGMLERQNAALVASRDAARRTATSFTQFTDSLNDSKVSLGDWIRDMAQQADALTNFQRNAERAADRGLRKGLIDALREAGPEGAMRMRQLANASESEIGRANAAWSKGQRAIDRYVDATGDVPKSLGTTIKVNGVPEAVTNVDRIRNALAQVKDKTVTIRVTQSGTAAVSPGFGPTGSADGGTVPKTGKPYADRHLYLLADGEEVISNRHGQADRHRSLLKAINGGLADGGTSGRKGDKRKVEFGFSSSLNTTSLEASIVDLTRRVENQTAVTEHDIESRDMWAQKMSDLAQATVAGFNTGLFDKSSNPWESGAGGGPLFNLTNDIAGLQERSALQAQLAGMGLSGDALAALLSQGTNADIASLIQSGGVEQYAALYNQRAALQGSVGQQAGEAAWGKEFAAANKAAEASMRELQKLNAASDRAEGLLNSMNQYLSTMGEDVGNATGFAITGAAANGQRTRNARGGGRR